MSHKEIMSRFENPVVLAFGNPLLDIFLTNDENHLLSKYDLKVDEQKELDGELMDQLITELPEEARQKMSAGGCAQNTVRMLQRLCGNENGQKLCIYCGGLGSDARGEILKKLLQSANIDARYAVHSTLPTGLCVSIVDGSYRSLLVNLGAAAVYTLENLRSMNLSLDGIKVIYIEGFFITHSLDVAKEVLKEVQGKDIVIVFNLCGTYIFEEHQAAICEMVGLSKIVIGNDREMTALANSLNLKFENTTDIPFLLNNLKRVTVNASNSSSSDWSMSDGIFIMTQGGSDPAIIVWGQGNSAQVPPIEPSSPIVDTTGAGDSLVAGFLAGLLSGQDPKTCLEWGCKVASKVITNLGASLPDELPDDFLT
ncbi:hypothetical protein QAD02_009950 [Eretmocerus hayati]|uniref:Uncharacterized protein n=1 Tax=Eretmocerus hayati TaxID=131215 RepID=A0ACC2NB34_9HYME|nr:hypothetical protein QAD02_009950 [Eretmocerus hayati]